MSGGPFLPRSAKLLLIGDCRQADETLSSFEWGAELSCQFRVLSWSDFEPLPMADWAADLLVAFVTQAEQKARAFFERLKDRPLAIPLLTMLDKGVSSEVRALALDASDDFLFWPASREELGVRVDRMLGGCPPQAESSADRLMREYCEQQLVGQHPTFQKIVSSLPRMAMTDLPVMITGETGTGKELFARAIHQLSARRRSPFIPVDCPGLPEQLFENELFGHVEGAYTDARRSQKGLVALAESGTLFLDEVDALPPATQPKLLRFLQEKVYRRLGEERFSSADVRVLAASNSDLEESARTLRFRSDLFYRLSVLRIHIPPLRMRRSDIPLLANHCLGKMSGEVGKLGLSFSRGGLDKLMTWEWPGNVRELFSVVQRAMVACDGKTILPAHIRFGGGSADEFATASEGNVSFAEAKARSIADFECNFLARLLREHRGNITQAAKAAGKERRAFGKLVKKYRLKSGR